jgi:hypothetical protein
MATSSTYYIDSSSFNTATSVYTNQELTIKAPDGYYSIGGLYRRQLFGNLQELVSCSGAPLPVNCVVSEWSEWSSCVDGSQTRTRTVITPAENGGTACPALTETQSCSSEEACTSYTHIASRDSLITYTACDGTPKSISTSRFSSYTFCAITGSQSGGTGTWFNNGFCS